MAPICGVVGKRDPSMIQTMLTRMNVPEKDQKIVEGERFCLGSSDRIDDHCVVDVPDDDFLDFDQLTAELRVWCWGQTSSPKKTPLSCGFALACVRDGGKECVIARDRLGRRPLFYWYSAECVVFCSSLRGMLATNLVKPILNLPAVDQFLAFGCVPAPNTVFQGIWKLLPGTRKYFRLNLPPVDECFDELRITPRKIEKSSAARILVSLLKSAIEKTSGPLLLWSGGVDSAAIAALKPSLTPVFVTLERGWQDETKAARDSARYLGNSFKPLAARRFTEDAFWRTIRHLDEPVANPHIFPIMLIFEQVARIGKSAVSAFGADETLGGFPRFRYLQRAAAAKKFIPSTILQGLLPALPPNALLRRGGRYLASFQDNLRSYLFLVSIFDREERGALYTDTMIAALENCDCAAKILEDFFVDTELTSAVLQFDLKIGLPELLLTPIKCLAHSQGIELELPFLDNDLVDFVLSLPVSVKYGVRSKPLLRHAMKGLLPPAIRLRPQRSFRIPQSGRVAATFDNIAEKVIAPERVDATGLFRWQEVEHIYRSSSHNVVRRRQFWALLLLLAWFQDVLER